MRSKGFLALSKKSLLIKESVSLDRSFFCLVSRQSSTAPALDDDGAWVLGSVSFLLRVSRERRQLTDSYTYWLLLELEAVWHVDGSLKQQQQQPRLLLRGLLL